MSRCARGGPAPRARALPGRARPRRERADGPALPDAAARPIEQHAVDFLVERGPPGRPCLVPVGPLTNVALALDKGAAPRPRIRPPLMGGAIAEGNMTPAAEFNIWADPEAAQQVFHAGVPVTMVGLDVTHKALLTSEWSERFRGAGRMGVFVAELVDFFSRYHARTYGWDGAPIHDALALAQVIRPGIVTTEHRNVEVELESELTRGRTVVDLWRRTDREPNVDVGVDVDGDAFLALLLERIATLD